MLVQVSAYRSKHKHYLEEEASNCLNVQSLTRVHSTGGLGISIWWVSFTSSWKPAHHCQYNDIIGCWDLSIQVE